MGDKGSQPSTSLESGRHFPLAPRRVEGHCGDEQGGKGGLRTSPPSSLSGPQADLGRRPGSKAVHLQEAAESRVLHLWAAGGGPGSAQPD